MGIETELKFNVAPQDLRKLRAAPALHRKPTKEENLISVYFDTPKHKLARNGVSLRVRHNGDKRLQTVKSEGSGDPFRRGEWEREIRGNVPNLRKAPGTAPASLLINKLKLRLKPIFATNVHRTRIPVFKNGSRIEVALDEGRVRAGRRSASISELELELKRGKAGDVAVKLRRGSGDDCLVAAFEQDVECNEERLPRAARDEHLALGMDRDRVLTCELVGDRAP